MVVIRFCCPACGHQVGAPEHAAGKKGRCPSCGGVTVVPTATSGAVAAPATANAPPSTATHTPQAVATSGPQPAPTSAPPPVATASPPAAAAPPPARPTMDKPPVAPPRIAPAAPSLPPAPPVPAHPIVLAPVAAPQFDESVVLYPVDPAPVLVAPRSSSKKWMWIAITVTVVLLALVVVVIAAGYFALRKSPEWGAKMLASAVESSMNQAAREMQQAAEEMQQESGGMASFEGNWLLIASQTGNPSLDATAQANLNNAQRHYILTRENGEYRFRPVNAPGGSSELKLKQVGNKLIGGGGSDGRTEFVIVNGRLVAAYFHPYTGAFSHRVTFQRE
jgi:hypothetical protein